MQHWRGKRVWSKRIGRGSKEKYPTTLLRQVRPYTNLSIQKRPFQCPPWLRHCFWIGGLLAIYCVHIRASYGTAIRVQDDGNSNYNLTDICSPFDDWYSWIYRPVKNLTTAAVGKKRVLQVTHRGSAIRYRRFKGSVTPWTLIMEILKSFLPLMPTNPML